MATTATQKKKSRSHHKKVNIKPETMSIPSESADVGAGGNANLDGENATGGGAGQKAETTTGYFRDLFTRRPELLRARSNDEITAAWLADHPGHDKLPLKVRQAMSNAKSLMRRKSRGAAPRGRRRAAAGQVGPNELEQLEVNIDECVMAARELDREGLESVIQLLRRARNEVVFKMGQ